MRASFRHEFVRFVPETLEEGCLYVSVEFASAAHKCACGCGAKVVTPISPTDWCLIYDGETVSLDPSIGNWSLPCRSHYWITRGKVSWAEQWSDAKIEAGRRLDALQKRRFFGRKATPSASGTASDSSSDRERMRPMGFDKGTKTKK